MTQLAGETLEASAENVDLFQDYWRRSLRKEQPEQLDVTQEEEWITPPSSPVSSPVIQHQSHHQPHSETCGSGGRASRRLVREELVPEQEQIYISVNMGNSPFPGYLA